MSKFWERFYNKCMSVNMTSNAVCKELGLSNATSTYWKNGAFPKGETLNNLADYFMCSADYLVGHEIQRIYSFSLCTDFLNNKEYIYMGYEDDIENAFKNDNLVNVKYYEMALGTMFKDTLELESLIEQYELMNWVNQLYDILHGTNRQNADDIILYLNNIKTSNIVFRFLINKIITSFNTSFIIALSYKEVPRFCYENYIKRINWIITALCDFDTEKKKVSGIKGVVKKTDNQWLTHYIVSDESIKNFMIMYRDIISKCGILLHSEFNQGENNEC